MSTDLVVNDNITLPDAPDIPGLSFRHFRGDEDYPSMVEINRTSKIADGLDFDLHTLETMKHAYSTTPNHDPYKDVFIAEIDGKMVAFNRAYMRKESDGSRVYWHFGFVLPAWRGKGIGSALIHAIERRIKEIEAGQAQEGPAFASTMVFNEQPALDELIKSEGYKAVRWEFHMETPNLDNIPDVPMPEGLEIRPVKPEHMHAIWAANSEAFQDHWGAEVPDETDFERFMSYPLLEPELWVVAWDGDQVAGSILNYINREHNKQTGRKLGYTESISVRRPWRRKGLARAMLARSMQVHKELGMTHTALGVDTQNPSGALELYKSMGYEVVGGATFYRKPI